MNISKILLEHAGLTAAVIGPTLIAVGYLYRARKDKKRNLREALYILLRLWYCFRMILLVDYEVLEKNNREVFTKLAPNLKVDTDKSGKEAKELMKSLRDYKDFDVNLIATYDEVVTKISGDLPTFAFSLTAHENAFYALTDAENHHRAFLKKAMRKSVKSEEYQKEVADFHAKYHLEKLQKKVLCQIEKDVRSLSFKIGVFTWVSTKVAMQKRKINERKNKKEAHQYYTKGLTEYRKALLQWARERDIKKGASEKVE
ncbi:MAG: hypothetical protein ABUK01_09825 [Leptospirales bacterium]